MSLIKNCEILENMVKLKIGIYMDVEKVFFFEGGKIYEILNMDYSLGNDSADNDVF